MSQATTAPANKSGAQQPKAGELQTNGKPAFGDRKPFCGAIVWYWEIGENPGSRPRPSPAMLVSESKSILLWNIKVFRMGMIQAAERRNVPYTDDPKVGSWSWPSG